MKNLKTYSCLEYNFKKCRKVLAQFKIMASDKLFPIGIIKESDKS